MGRRQGPRGLLANMYRGDSGTRQALHSFSALVVRRSPRCYPQLVGVSLAMQSSIGRHFNKPIYYKADARLDDFLQAQAKYRNGLLDVVSLCLCVCRSRREIVICHYALHRLAAAVLQLCFYYLRSSWNAWPVHLWNEWCECMPCK